jgi:hypothetical protein
VLIVRSIIIVCSDFFFSWRDSPLVGLGLLIHEVCCL